MSELAPSFPLFMVSIIFTIYCNYTFFFKKESVNRYSSPIKILFYSLHITSSIVFTWGLIFLFIYLFQ